jgi:hypothetical protein
MRRSTGHRLGHHTGDGARIAMRLHTVVGGGVVAPAVAGPIEYAFVAYERATYATALRLMRPLAEAGQADAQIGSALIKKIHRKACQED